MNSSKVEIISAKLGYEYYYQSSMLYKNDKLCLFAHNITYPIIICVN